MSIDKRLWFIRWHVFYSLFDTIMLLIHKICTLILQSNSFGPLNGFLFLKIVI
jgi:hypothetical protein